MLRTAMVLALSMLSLSGAQAEVVGTGLCDRAGEACRALQADDTSGSSGGIGSKKGTGGGGTNAVRPDVLREAPNLPAGPRLPNAPKRFGFQ